MLPAQEIAAQAVHLMQAVPAQAVLAQAVPAVAVAVARRIVRFPRPEGLPVCRGGGGGVASRDRQNKHQTHVRTYSTPPNGITRSRGGVPVEG